MSCMCETPNPEQFAGCYCKTMAKPVVASRAADVRAAGPVVMQAQQQELAGMVA